MRRKAKCEAFLGMPSEQEESDMKKTQLQRILAAGLSAVLLLTAPMKADAAVWGSTTKAAAFPAYDMGNAFQGPAEIGSAHG